MTIVSKYHANCQACAKALKPGDAINWVRGLKAVTCAGCPMPVSDTEAALVKDGQALRQRIGELTREVQRMALLAHDARVEHERAIRNIRDLQAMLDDMHRLTAMHYSKQERTAIPRLEGWQGPAQAIVAADDDCPI